MLPKLQECGGYQGLLRDTENPGVMSGFRMSPPPSSASNIIPRQLPSPPYPLLSVPLSWCSFLPQPAFAVPLTHSMNLKAVHLPGVPLQMSPGFRT